MAQLTQASLATLDAAALAAELSAGVSNGAMRGLRFASAPKAIEAFDWARWEYMLGVARRKEDWRAAAGHKVPGSHVVIYETLKPRRVRALSSQYTWRNVMDKHAEQQLTVKRYNTQMHDMMVMMQQHWLRLMEKHITDVGDYQFIEQRALEAARPLTIQYHERARAWAGLRTGKGHKGLKRALASLATPDNPPIHRTSTGSGPSPSVMSLNARGPSGRVQSWKMPGGRSRTRSASTA